MKEFKFNKELYSKTALLKAAYNFTDIAYLHLDVDDKYYYVDIEQKSNKKEIKEIEFENDILTQSVRHEVYLQTKNIRELMLARAVATSVVTSEEYENEEFQEKEFTENEILKDWFSEDEK